ncbi:glycosyltransferase [bacterium]|nr:glycosyltransferase [bacterium]
MLEDAARHDRRLRVFHMPEADLVAALNFGLSQCRADLIARMDADDRSRPERLARQVARMDAQPAIDACGTCVAVFRATGPRAGYRAYERWINGLLSHEAMRRERFIESPIPHPSAMFRRTWITSMQGYRNCGWAEDYDLWLRGFSAGAVFAKCPEVLLDWRDHEGRLSRRHARYAQESFLRCKAHHLAIALGKESRPIALWGAGPIGKRLLRCLRAEGVTPAAVVDIDPKKIGRTRQGIPVVAPEALASGGWFVLTAAIRAGARGEIVAALGGMGYAEEYDFLCCA